MPCAPRSRQRRASSSGLFVRSSLTYGTSSPPARSAWASVRSFGTRERRLAVVLVHAEDVRAREAEAVEQPGQLVVVADHPVDVVPEMRVRVVEERALGELGAERLAIRVDDRPSALE